MRGTVWRMKRELAEGLLRLREKGALADWTCEVCHGILFCTAMFRCEIVGD